MDIFFPRKTGGATNRGRASTFKLLQRPRYCPGTEEGPRGNENESTALCDTCNRNQDMKVHQLRQFSPSNSKNEDQELQGILTCSVLFLKF